MADTSFEFSSNLIPNVVVIGGGISGLSAALSMSENICTTIVIEQTDFLYDEKNSDEASLFVVKRNYAQIYKSLMAFANYRCNPILMRDTVFESFNTLRWLNSYGVAQNLHSGDENTVRVNESVLYQEILKVLKQKQNVALYSETVVMSVSRTDARYTIVAKSKHSEEIVRFNADAVCFACGGFAGDLSMLEYAFDRKLAKNVLIARENGGSIIRQAWDLGASSKGNNIICGGGIAAGLNTPCTNALLQMPVLWVNKHGRRVAKESIVNDKVFCSNCFQYQHGFLWSIYDRTAIRKRIDTSQMKLFEDEMSLLIEHGDGVIAPTLMSLADQMGIPSVQLTATTERYNDAVSNGEDVEFFKESEWLTEKIESAPFYAIKARLVVEETFGGIEIDSSYRVLTPTGAYLRGAFACGNAASGPYFVSNVRQNGFSLQWALTSGRRVGKSVIGN